MAQGDNMDQGRLIGISLPKSDVMLDHVLIYIGQSWGRVEESTRHSWMRERVPYHKTSSICQNGLPGAIPLRDQSTSNPYHKTFFIHYKQYKTSDSRPGAALPHKLSYSWSQDYKFYTKTLPICSSLLGGIYRPRSGVHGTSAPMTKDLEKWQKAVKEKQTCVKTQYSRIVYPKEYANTVQPVTTQHSTNSTTTYHLPLIESRLPKNMTKDPLSEFFLNKRTWIYAWGYRVRILRRDFQFFQQ
jgi:hypothetical protein